MFKNKFIFLWLPVILYAGLIFYLSSLPRIALPLEFPFLDKLLHIGEYAVLGFLLIRALKISLALGQINKLYLLVMVIAFLYGLTDELHQAFVPGRNVSFWDALSDGVGGLLGALIYR